MRMVFSPVDKASMPWHKMAVNGQEWRPMKKIVPTEKLDIRVILDPDLSALIKEAAKRADRSLQQEVRYRLRNTFQEIR